MMVPRSTDVLIAGAGPAGVVTAVSLAARGMRVLLVDPAAPDVDNGGESAAGGHDVWVTGSALRGLHSLELPVSMPLRPAAAIDLRFGAASARQIAAAGAAVCEWSQFRHALRRAAVDSGARCARGTLISLVRGQRGYEAVIRHARGETQVTAAHAVMAVGGIRSGLAPVGSPQSAGIACAQRFTGAELDDRIVLVLSTPSASGSDEHPGCVWALPGANGTITVGLARVGDGAVDPRELPAAALAMLTAAEPRLAALRPAGPTVIGPLDTGFAPARVRRAGFILVGEAAGLVNPFTGEGLSYAVQSGLLAADLIAANRSDPEEARRQYVRRVARASVGYFETARHAVRRYHLTWRVLAAGADSNHPFFARCRHAILLPEGFSGSAGPTAVRPRNLPRPDIALLTPFLVACDEVKLSVVRGEWPFLARLTGFGESLDQRSQRLAVPFFAALMAAGHRPDITRATLAAAIELTLLGTIAVLGPSPPPAATRGVDWAQTVMVLAGDFLLAQASRLVTRSAPEISWSFADWLAELTMLRAARLSQPSDVPAWSMFASMFEYPARIGAQLSGCGPETARALRDFGYSCGCVFAHAEDVLALRGERTRLDTTLEVMLQGRFSGIPDHLGGRPVAETDLADPRLRHAALAAATAACRQSWQDSLNAAAAVPDREAARILREFAGIAAAPVTRN
jgi:menaquinone-9 beta-reductase